MLFKCLRSGNTVNIDDPEDIERMKTHEGYEVVNHKETDHGLQTEDAEAFQSEAPEAKEVKKRGRPKKE